MISNRMRNIHADKGSLIFFLECYLEIPRHHKTFIEIRIGKTKNYNIARYQTIFMHLYGFTYLSKLLLSVITRHTN